MVERMYTRTELHGAILELEIIAERERARDGDYASGLVGAAAYLRGRLNLEGAE